MKKIFSKTIIITILLLFTLSTKAQLYETSIDYNPILQSKSKTLTFDKENIDISDTIELPILDDFSERSIYPSNRFWIDSNVFVNNQFCDTPVFVGVATFDCLNKNGEIYERANSYTFIADTLVSRYINLDYSPSDSIYLSFYYQPQGLAYDPPEERDSLVLKFKAPGIQWQYIWHAAGEPNKPFTRVMIPITDSIYLQKGFQMQFLNYASMSSDNRSSNGDYWHLDLVYLDTARSINDTLIPDVGFVTTPGSYLIDYYSVPCKHFNKNYDAKNNKQSYRNNSNEVIGLDRKLYITASNSTNTEEENIGGSIDLQPFTYSEHNFNYTTTLFSPVYFIGEDSLTFKIESVLHLNQGVAEEFLWNDTAHFTQTFYNYYAYDDGTAEAGIGMDGLESQGAMLAVKFYPIKADTLQAVKFWFNKTNKDATKNLAFDLIIWDNNNGIPGDIIYEQDDQYIQYGAGIDNYVFYILDNPLWLEDTFFVGFRQNHETYMNLGFDKNTDTHEKTFYSFGSWQQSLHKGSLMIRPVFGDRLKVNIEKQQTANKILIYPNPAKNTVTIRAKYQIKNIIIYNISGLKIIEKDNINTKQTSVNITQLNTGAYIININTQNNTITKKLFVK